MKILFILFFMISSSNVHAQIYIEHEPPCPYLSQFEGEWRYINGQDTIKIYLRYARISLGDSTNPDDSPVFIRDYLVGWHDYKHASIVYESNYSNRFMTIPFNLSSVFGTYSITLSLDNRYNLCNPSARRLKGRIDDLSVCSELRDVTSVIANQQINQLVWKQKMPEWFGHCTGCNGSMTLPAEFVLIKQ